MTRLSVILTNFNDAHFLNERISSILHQLGHDDELVLIDDASQDHSLSIISSFVQRDPRMVFLKNEVNQGPILSANRAILHAKGDYVCWLAADDILLPGMIERSLEPFEEIAGIALVFSNHVTANETGSKIQSFPQLHKRKHLLWIPKEKSAKLFRENLLWIPGHTTFVKRDLLIDFGLFDVAFGPHCDWFAFHGIALLHGCVYLPQDLAALRTLPHSYSQTIKRKKSASRQFRNAIFERLEKTGNEMLNQKFKQSGLLRHMIRPDFIRYTLYPNYWKQLMLFYYLGVKSKLRKLFYTGFFAN